MDKNKICSACKEKVEKDNYKRDRTVCRKCYEEKRKEKIKVTTKSKANNQRTLTLTLTIKIEQFW